MTYKELIHVVRRRLRNPVTKQSPDDDEFDFLELARVLLSDISDEFSWRRVHLDPIVKTYTGQSEYPLPRDFGSNFVRGSGFDGRERVCKLNDGSVETFLSYEVPEKLFGNDWEVVANSKPTSYTVMTNESGYKFIKIFPPPNSNSDSHYEIRGMYRPDYSKVELSQNIPAEARNYLTFALLALLEERSQVWLPMRDKAWRDIYMIEARNRKSQFVPRLGKNVGYSEYEEMTSG